MGVRRIGGGLLAIVAVAVPAVIQAMGLHIPATVGYPLLALCALAFVLGLVLAFWPEKPKEVGVAGDDFSIKAKVTGGTVGQIGHVFNKPKARSLADLEGVALQEQLKREAPRDRVVHVLAVANDGEAFALAVEIAQFLAREGRQVRGVDTLMSAGPPIVGIRIRPDIQGVWELAVGFAP